MDEIQFYLEDLRSKFSKIDFTKYYLSYSGGKDSHFLYWFIKEYLKDDIIEIVSVNTYMEFPEISNRMIKYADTILIPKLKPHEVLQTYGMPCFGKNHDEMIESYQKGNRSDATMMYINGTRNGSHTMYKLSAKARELLLNDRLPNISSKCCTYLKKKPLLEYEKRTNKKAIIGVMQSESLLRKAKYNSCFTKNGKFTPLFDAKQSLIDQIYERYNIDLPKIYQYLNQTGCAGCPYGIGLKHTRLELEQMTPAKRRYVLKLFSKAYEIRGVDYNQLSLFDE